LPRLRACAHAPSSVWRRPVASGVCASGAQAAHNRRCHLHHSRDQQQQCWRQCQRQCRRTLHAAGAISPSAWNLEHGRRLQTAAARQWLPGAATSACCCGCGSASDGARDAGLSHCARDCLPLCARHGVPDRARHTSLPNAARQQQRRHGVRRRGGRSVNGVCARANPVDICTACRPEL
jgi:hypothetical protein